MEKSCVDHVAIFVDDLCWYQNFFEQTLNFKEKKRQEIKGELKQLWLDGGIQLIHEQRNSQSRMAHIGIAVRDVPTILKKMHIFNLKGLSKGMNWLELPNGVILELIEQSNQ